MSYLGLQARDRETASVVLLRWLATQKNQSKTILLPVLNNVGLVNLVRNNL